MKTFIIVFNSEKSSSEATSLFSDFVRNQSDSRYECEMVFSVAGLSAFLILTSMPEQDITNRLFDRNHEEEPVVYWIAEYDNKNDVLSQLSYAVDWLSESD